MISSTLGAAVPMPERLPTILILFNFASTPSTTEKDQASLMYILVSDDDTYFIIPEVGRIFGSR